MEKHIELCWELKVFGKCERMHCAQCHILSNKYNYVANLPKSGVVKFKILSVQDINCYTVCLLEHTDCDGYSCEIENYFNLFNMHLKSMLKNNNTHVKNVKVGCIYVHYDDENDVCQRCKVLEIVSVFPITKVPDKVKVKWIDIGGNHIVPTLLLYELPDNLKNVDPQGNLYNYYLNFEYYFHLEIYSN